MTKDFLPFANESDVLTLGNLEIGNRVDRLTLQGDVELTKDKRGLALARQLKAVLDAAVAAMEADKALPDQVQVDATVKINNPFV